MAAGGIGSINSSQRSQWAQKGSKHDVNICICFLLGKTVDRNGSHVLLKSFHYSFLSREDTL